MTAKNRVGAPLRTSLGVETLEGRALPSTVTGQDPVADQGVVWTTQETNTNSGNNWSSSYNWHSSYHYNWGTGNHTHTHPAAVVVSDVFVNGHLAAAFNGTAQFAMVGPAVGVDANGNQVEIGGTTLSVNGQNLGTFAGTPQIQTVVSSFATPKGGSVTVYSYFVTGTPLASDPSTLWHGPTTVGGPQVA